MPLDSFGRTIDYLRVSVIDHCNLRCVYCMPLTGLKFTPSSDLLRAEEIETVVRAAANVGFRKVRLTGGEPTLRSDIVEIAERIGRVPGIADLAMTTNGVLLPELATGLVAAGLKRVNIHIDSLNPDRLAKVMRFGKFEDIWRGVEAAEAAGMKPIKLNCVVVRDFNDEDVIELAELTVERDWHVRFIELMPFGMGECAAVSREKFVSSQETREQIERRLGRLIELPAKNRSDESRNFRILDGRGVIGFISPVSEPYCDSCNRMRLTADGKLHLCLLNDDEVDLRAALRGGGGSKELERLIEQAVTAKPFGHKLHQGVSTRERIMYQLGG